ncbi:MAG: protein tyrosine phosphatase [Cyanobacteriota bacterium]|nr:protein tyrosine phosphatase [Cyanobacteriota bacterium]
MHQPIKLPLKLLFICSRNQWRSPTAERLFDRLPQYSTKSAGTQHRSRVRVTAGLLGWADRIFVMEKRHGEYLRRKFPEALRGKQPICLHVGDRYRYMDAELVRLLQDKLEPYLS